MKVHTRISNSTRQGSAVVLALVCVTVVAGLAVAFLRISTAASARQNAAVESADLTSVYQYFDGTKQTYVGVEHVFD